MVVIHKNVVFLNVKKVNPCFVSLNLIFNLWVDISHQLTAWFFSQTVLFETFVILSQLRQKPDDYIDVGVDVAEMKGTSAETKTTYEKIKKYVAEHNDGMKVSSLYIAQVKRKCGLELVESFNLPKLEDSKQAQCPKDKEEAIVEA